MSEAYIFDAIRTPRGKGKKGGGLYTVKPITLVANLLNELKERKNLDTSQVENIVLGCIALRGLSSVDGLGAREMFNDPNNQRWSVTRNLVF